MSKTKSIVLGSFAIFMFVMGTNAQAQKIPAREAKTLTDTKVSTEKNTDDKTTTADDARVDEEKPSVECQFSCMDYSKTCGESCKSYAEDESLQRDCNLACLAIFTDENGYCYAQCAPDEYLLTTHRPEKEETASRTSDECLDGCEDHYGACVILCRDTIVGDSVKLKGCYNDCTLVFAEETGFCKSQCEVDAGFMLVGE